MQIHRRVWLVVWGVLLLAADSQVIAQDAREEFSLHPDEQAKQLERPDAVAALVQTTAFIRAGKARSEFRVSGRGLAVAVLDTGINAAHVDFAEGKDILAVRNFTGTGKAADANDGNGHGTNVSGIVAANRQNKGIAPDAKIVALKVLDDKGAGNFRSVEQALAWVLKNHKTHDITVVNVSLGDSLNYSTDSFKSGGVRDRIRKQVAKLRKQRIPVVVAAGNDFFKHKSKQGMGFPAIIRETISVGAVYDADIGPAKYKSGAAAKTTAAGRLTPFSQRLSPGKLASPNRTDIFAPGAPLTSSGTNGKTGQSIMHGTSQAAPVTSGVILLIQQLHKRALGELPKVDQIERWLRLGVVVNDGDDEKDNVTNTGLDYVRLDAYRSLSAVNAQIRVRLLKGDSKP